MNPLEEYISLIHYWQQNPCKVKGEVHHIIPKSCGGPDEDWNKVCLPTLDHINCHRLLALIYTKGKEHKAMAKAYSMILTSREGVVFSPEEAARARQLSSESRRGICPVGAWKPGHTPWNKDKKTGPHTEEWKQKVSAKLTGRKASDERRRKISEALRGKPKSEEHKKHLSENHADVSKMKDPTTGRFTKRNNS